MSESHFANIGVHESGELLTTSTARVAPMEPVSGPDFIVQIRDISGDPPCLSPDARLSVEQALSLSFTAAFPGAYVDATCAGGPDPANEAAAFGVWLTAPADPSAARSLLDNSIGRTQTETIAVFINKTLFDAAADKFFPSDPNGHTHLHPPAQLEFRSPDTVLTRVSGVDTEPVPDASFTVTITETFNGGPRSAPPDWFVATPSLDVDQSWLYDVEAFLLTLPLIVSPLGIVTTAIGWAQAYEVNTQGPPSVQGFGSAVASLCMPLDIPIAGGLKRPIQYALRGDHNGGVEVDDNGMYVGGYLLSPVPRTPSVSLSGQTTITVPISGDDAYDTITASTHDMRGNLTFAWTVNGDAFPSTGSSITFSFSPGSGPFGTQDITATVTDEDGLSAVGSMQVFVEPKQRSASTGDPNSPSLHPA